LAASVITLHKTAYSYKIKMNICHDKQWPTVDNTDEE